jgi:hypothetical protein
MWWTQVAVMVQPGRCNWQRLASRARIVARVLRHCLVLPLPQPLAMDVSVFVMRCLHVPGDVRVLVATEAAAMLLEQAGWAVRLDRVPDPDRQPLRVKAGPV